MYVDTLSDSGMGCDNTPVHKYSTVYKEIIHGVWWGRAPWKPCIYVPMSSGKLSQKSRLIIILNSNKHIWVGYECPHNSINSFLNEFQFCIISLMRNIVMKKTILFLWISFSLYIRTETSWRSWGIRRRGFVKDWAATGCHSPSPRSTSWVLSTPPWSETQVTQTVSMVKYWIDEHHWSVDTIASLAKQIVISIIVYNCDFGTGRNTMEKKGLPRRNSDRFNVLEDNYILSGFKPALTMCTFIKQVLFAEFITKRIFKRKMQMGLYFFVYVQRI